MEHNAACIKDQIRKCEIKMQNQRINHKIGIGKATQVK